MTYNALLTIALAACATASPPAKSTRPPAKSTPPPVPFRRAATPLPAWMHQAAPEQLNGKHHRLQIDLVDQFVGPPLDALDALAVGADIAIAVPGTLGSGHGPFSRVYPGPGTVNAKSSVRDAINISVLPQPRENEDAKLSIRCNRAGVFELAVAITDADGTTIDDALDIDCVTPTRFTADVAAQGPYLAQASALDVTFAWFGKRSDGSEATLIGTLPVAPATTAIAPKGERRFAAVHAATSVAWTSAGLTATLPIEIEDAPPSTLDITFEPSGPSIHGDKAFMTARPRAVDDKGRLLAGLAACTLTSFDGGVESPAEQSCITRIVRKNAIAPGQHRQGHFRTADRVCFAVLGKTACKAVPQ